MNKFISFFKNIFRGVSCFSYPNKQTIKVPVKEI